MSYLPVLRVLPFVALFTVSTSGLWALDVGEKAPALSGVTWLKGNAPAAGIPVIVEFWATWCGPCKTSIPHLAKLAQDHAGKLAVVGLSDEEQTTVAPFIGRNKMEYNVGLLQDPGRNSWMEGVDGIPHAFLVAADGTVLWKGHPMELDPVVEQVLAGTWDSKAMANLEGLRKRLQDELTNADVEDAASVAKVTATAKEVLALAPADEEAIGVLVGVAQHKGDTAGARAVWESLAIEQMTPGQAASLARTASDAAELEFRHLTVARKLALHAVAGAPREAGYQEILARVEYACGRIEDAIAAQEKALHAATGSNDDARQQAILEFYVGVLALRAGKEPPAPKPIAVPAKPKAPAEEPQRIPAPAPILP